jgi:hypothetical protein
VVDSTDAFAKSFIGINGIPEWPFIVYEGDPVVCTSIRQSYSSGQRAVAILAIPRAFQWIFFARLCGNVQTTGKISKCKRNCQPVEKESSKSIILHIKPISLFLLLSWNRFSEGSSNEPLKHAVMLKQSARQSMRVPPNNRPFVEYYSVAFS